jgi:protein ImuB
MPRVVSVYLPTWPTDRWRRKRGAPPPEVPFAMVGREGNRNVVTAADIVARSFGIRVGMPATKAQALVAELVIRDSDPDGDRAALERLAVWALRYSPVVAADPPDGLVLDTTGADHLRGGESAMLADAAARLAGAGVRVRVAISDTWGASHALARLSADERAIVPVGRTPGILAGLPISALRLDPDTVADLRKLGFERIRDLEATPRAPLTLRFGPLVCRRLDQVLGQAAEPIEPVRPPEIIEVRRVFAEPIGASETIHRYVGQLVVRLCAALEERGLGARRLDLLFGRVDDRVQAVRVGTSTSTRNVKRLIRLLGDKIETVDPGFGIEEMRLAATLAEPLHPKQAISSLTEEPEADVAGLIDVLSNRVGDARVYRFAPVASDVPERTIAKVAAASPATDESWPAGWPRPARLLQPPETIDTVALLPDHPPVSFTWRGIRRRVKRADGPERVFGEWWKGERELVAVRDYFQVEDDAGERFWIFRAGDGEHAATGSQGWFLHGIFA